MRWIHGASNRGDGNRIPQLSPEEVAYLTALINLLAALAQHIHLVL